MKTFTPGSSPPGAQTPQLMQHLAALQRGQEIRLERARTKRLLAKTPRDELFRRVAPLLGDEPPRHLRTLAVRDFLLSMRGVGTMRANAMLSRAGVASSSKPLQDLTARQRRALLDEIHDHVERGRS